MNDEPTFFDARGTVIAFARRSDPDTSRAAAEAISPRIRKLQFDVLSYAESCGAGGFIDPAMNDHFGVNSSTYRTRRSELVDLGLIADTGQRRTIGDGGRKFAVWAVTMRGLAMLQAAARDEAA